MADAQHPAAVGEDLPVQLFGLGAPSLPGGEPGEGGARGHGVGMVIAEDAVPGGEHLTR